MGMGMGMAIGSSGTRSRIPVDAARTSHQDFALHPRNSLHGGASHGMPPLFLGLGKGPTVAAVASQVQRLRAPRR